MKFVTVFAALLAVACAQNTWTLQQLSDAIASPNTDPALKPYLENALNQMVDALWAGHQIEAVTVTVPSMEITSMTLNELSEALQNPETDPALIPQLEAALNQLMDALFAGVPVEAATVVAPSMEIHHYTLHQLSEALQNPATSPAAIPHLEHALNEMMEAAFSGHAMEVIVIAVPAGSSPVVPVVPLPVEVDAPSVPEVPSVPEAPASPSSPLVQIIVNINQQSAALPAEPVEIPADPVNVVDHAPIVPIDVVDVAPVVVKPVEVVDVMPVIVNPVDVIDVMPVIVNPVEVVDTAPVAPVIIGMPAVHQP